MNQFDFEQNNKVQNFVNIMFDHSMIPIIYKPTHITKETATATDYIFIYYITASKFKTGIIKSDILDHFWIFFVADYNGHINETKQRCIFRRDLSNVYAEKFKCKLRAVSWDSIIKFSDTNNAYNNFIEIFSSLYDDCFPKKEIKLKPQKYNNPWITQWIKKSSKRKPTLQENFLKNGWKKMRNYMNLIKVKHKSNRIHCSTKTLKHGALWKN